MEADPDVLATAVHLANSIGYTLNITVGKKTKEVSIEQGFLFDSPELALNINLPFYYVTPDACAQ